MRKIMINKENSELSMRKQCELLAINRSTLYYQPKGESDENLALMRLLDEQYTRTPFYGVLKMTRYLRNQGYIVNEKRVRRLLRKMGLNAVYPSPKLSEKHPRHKIYPYLLRGKKINGVNQVWSTDITYIRLSSGFVYLMAVIDWHSRYVLTWSLSTTLDADFCIEAVGDLLSPECCEIFNTDQGSQFTTQRFIQPLLDNGIQVSMDGRGRALDNIFIERLWRTVKYELIYLHEYRSVKEVYDALKDYFYFYHNERLHQSLDYATPAQVHHENSLHMRTLLTTKEKEVLS